MTTPNKRNFYRLALSVPLSGTLKMIGVNEKKIDSKPADILIHDIGAGGMRIHVRASFPVTPGLLLEFRFRLFHTEHKCLGTIVRKASHTEAVYEYGIVFSLDETERRSVLQHVNMLNVKLRGAPRLSSCSFATEEQLAKFYAAPQETEDVPEAANESR